MLKDAPCTLDPGLTILALRGLSKPSSYPFVERHLWRRRAIRLRAAITVSLRGRARTRTAMPSLVQAPGHDAE